MPRDFEINDEIGAPELCAYHRTAIANLAAKDHVGDEDSERAAESIAHQCCNRRPA